MTSLIDDTHYHTTAMTVNKSDKSLQGDSGQTSDQKTHSRKKKKHSSPASPSKDIPQNVTQDRSPTKPDISKMVNPVDHTYENVQSIRQQQALNNAKKNKLRQSKESPREDIPLTPLTPQSESKTYNTSSQSENTSSRDCQHRPSQSPAPSIMLASTATLSSYTSGTYTMSGTLKRGKKKDEVVEVQVELTQSELECLNKSTIEESEPGYACDSKNGLHVVLLSVFFMPFAFISSLCMCFYLGSMCWYNVYLCLSEERTIWHKIFICPFLILFYPVLIVSSALILAIFAAGKQISWRLSSWKKEIQDFDKGFYRWLCIKINLPECSPYEVIILNEAMLSDCYAPAVQPSPV